MEKDFVEMNFARGEDYNSTGEEISNAFQPSDDDVVNTVEPEVVREPAQPVIYAYFWTFFLTKRIFSNVNCIFQPVTKSQFFKQ